MVRRLVSSCSTVRAAGLAYASTLILGGLLGCSLPPSESLRARPPSSSTHAATAGPRLHQVAATATRPAGAPKYSDVCLRYGWVRSSSPTVADAKAAIAGFHATRVDWFYPGAHAADGPPVTQESRDFIAWCHQRGMKVGGAMNTNTTNLAWRLKDGPAGRYIGDPAIPAYVSAAIAWGKAQIDAGLDTLVCDDFFYFDASQQAAFNTQVILAIKAYRPGFSLASNHGGFLGADYVSAYAFDFHYSDSNFIATPGSWWAVSKEHRLHRSAAISHPNKAMTRWEYRTQIALGYATGSHVIMPWDEFLSGAPRFFGDPAEYADVSAFARCLGERGLLDGYEDAAVGGHDLLEDRYPTPPLGVVSGNSQLSLFARAIPGDAKAKVVVHLVKWGGSGSSTVRLLTQAFFGGAPLAIELWTRKPYALAEHLAAEQSGDFKALRWDRTTDITVKTNGDWTEVDTPELYSWGVLVVRDKSAVGPDAGIDAGLDAGPLDAAPPDGGVDLTVGPHVDLGVDGQADAVALDGGTPDAPSPAGCGCSLSAQGSAGEGGLLVLLLLLLGWRLDRRGQEVRRRSPSDLFAASAWAAGRSRRCGCGPECRPKASRGRPR